MTKKWDAREAWASLTPAQQNAHTVGIAVIRQRGAMERCQICKRPVHGFAPRENGTGRYLTLAEAGICDC